MVSMDGQLTPGSYEPLRFTFLIWVMVIVGGSGNNWGAVLGGFVIWFLWVQVEPAGRWFMELVTSGMADGSETEGAFAWLCQLYAAVDHGRGASADAALCTARADPGTLMRALLLPAAGASSRMRGRDKLLEHVDGVALLRRSCVAGKGHGGGSGRHAAPW